jgi:hypothetical protein
MRAIGRKVEVTKSAVLSSAALTIFSPTSASPRPGAIASRR